MNHNQILKRDKQTTIRSIGIIEIGAEKEGKIPIRFDSIFESDEHDKE